MVIEEFLQTDFLAQTEAIGPEYRDFLMRMGDLASDLGCNQIFGEFEPAKDQQSTENAVRALRDRINLIKASDVRRPEFPVKATRLGAWKQRVGGTNNRHLRAVLGIAGTTDVLTNPDPVHVYDACCGSGILSSSIGFLRGERKTSVTAIDRNPVHAAVNSVLSRILGGGNLDATFLAQDIRATSLAKADGLNTYCMSKHSCGPATDAIIDTVANTSEQTAPDQVALLTCCHGTTKNHIPENVSRTGLSLEDWNALVKIADWTCSANEEARTIGRIAMRIVDCLRVCNLPDFLTASVAECVDRSLTQKNHCILLKKEA